jgi:hypothetical protein
MDGRIVAYYVGIFETPAQINAAFYATYEL